MNRTHARLLPAALVIALTLLAAPAAHAQFGLLGSGIVFDPSNFARNVLHYARRLEQIAMQKLQLQQQLVAMRKLPSPPWRDIRQTVARLDGLMADGRAIPYLIAVLPGGLIFGFLSRLGVPWMGVPLIAFSLFVAVGDPLV